VVQHHLRQQAGAWSGRRAVRQARHAAHAQAPWPTRGWGRCETLRAQAMARRMSGPACSPTRLGALPWPHPSGWSCPSWLQPPPGGRCWASQTLQARAQVQVQAQAQAQA
jgi:hypothetical protein